LPRVKRWIVAAGLVAIAAIVVGMRASDRADGPRAASAAGASADRSSSAPPASPGHAERDVPDRDASGAAAAPAIRAPIHIRRVDPAEREAIEQRIAEARASRAAGGAPVPDHVDQLDLEHAPVELRDALDASIPIVSECFHTDGADARPDGAIVLFTLRGDRDVGTLVDPDQITDGDGKPLDPRLADCLHTTLTSLELPPLAHDQELPLQFTYRP
jgi:hypothetical protein